MTDMIKIGSKLALICAIAALCLGAVNMVTEPQIALMRAQKLQAALEKVSPGGIIGEQIVVTEESSVISFYPVKDGDEMTGYILNLEGSGYGGDLIILASYKPDGELLDSVLMEHDETPGLGKEAENEWYMQKYIGLTGSDIPTRKNQLAQEDADAISGATITFSGLGNALVAGSDFVADKEGK